MQSMKFMQRLLRLYPRLWRERYETEMFILLEQHHITFATIIDLLLGALDARLDPHYRSPGPLFALNSRRTLATLFVSALAVFIYTALLRDQFISPLSNLSPFPPPNNPILLATNHTIMMTFLGCIAVVSLVALLYNLFSSIIMLKNDLARHRKIRPFFTILRFLLPFPLLLPLLYFSNLYVFLPPRLPFSMSAIRLLLLAILPLELIVGSLFTAVIKLGEAVVTRRRWLFLLAFFIYLLMPISLSVCDILTTSVPLTFTGGMAFYDYLDTLIFLVLFASVGSLLLAVANSEMSRRAFRIILVLAAVLTLLMVVTLSAYSTWVIADCLQGPALVAPTRGLWLLLHGQWLYPVITNLAIMALALATALIALLRGFATLAPHRSTHSDASETHLIQSQQRR